MGNFYLVLPKAGCGPEAGRLFGRGKDAFSSLKRFAPCAEIAGEDWIHAASFARRNGSGGVIARHRNTPVFLLATGTWFHDTGLGTGDEERLLNDYLRASGSRVAAALQGFFTVVIADGRSREALVITDIIGSCHCYIREFSSAFAISSSPLVLAALEQTSLDHVACQEFLQTGIMYEERTFFREVRKLAPASIYRFSATRFTSETYWDAKALAGTYLQDEMAVRELWENLLVAGRRIGRTFSRPVCDLTGGYDSRALAAAFSSSDMKLSTTVSGPPESADVRVAQRLAGKVGLPILHMAENSVPKLDELNEAFAVTDGEYDVVDYVRIQKTHQALSAQFDISLNGSFGEVARGYWWELLIPRTGHRIKLDSENLARKRYAYLDKDPLYAPELRIALAPHFARVIERTNAGLFDSPNTFQMDHAYLYMRMQCWQGRIARSTNQLWPCLSPFMLRPILTVLLTTQPSLRKRSLMIRRMLAEFSPMFANEPLEYGYPAAPVRLNNLHSFWPLVVYYRLKVVDRLASKLRAHAHSQPAAEKPGRSLTSDPELQHILEPAKMRLASVLDQRSLQTFLSSQAHIGPGHKWRFLFTLEYTLQQLAGFSGAHS